MKNLKKNPNTNPVSVVSMMQQLRNLLTVKLKIFNLMDTRYIFLLLFFLTNNFYAQSTIYINFLNPIVSELNPNGDSVKVPFYNGTESRKTGFNGLVSSWKSRGIITKKSFRTDVYWARIKKDNDDISNNGNEEYESLIIWLNDYEYALTTPYSVENEYTSRYRYYTNFWIGTLMSNAKYSIKEYVPVGSWGINLVQNEYTYDHVLQGSYRSKIFTLDPDFKGVFKTMTISGN